MKVGLAIDRYIYRECVCKKERIRKRAQNERKAKKFRNIILLLREIEKDEKEVEKQNGNKTMEKEQEKARQRL